jgi:hypothetical protein
MWIDIMLCSVLLSLAIATYSVNAFVLAGGLEFMLFATSIQDQELSGLWYQEFKLEDFWFYVWVFLEFGWLDTLIAERRRKIR